MTKSDIIRFLRHKVAEYEKLQIEIEVFKKEVKNR